MVRNRFMVSACVQQHQNCDSRSSFLLNKFIVQLIKNLYEPSHLSPPMSPHLDQHCTNQIEVFIVCTEELVST
jgi:hypothetical protein